MRRCIVFVLLLVVTAYFHPVFAAEITDVVDAADDNDPFDLNIDVQFRSVLNKSKITHEVKWLWEQQAQQNTNQPDLDQLRFEQQIYAMDAMLEIGLYQDLEIYATLPWIISDKKQIRYVSGQNNFNSTLYRSANTNADYPGNALAEDPTNGLSTKRAGIGDLQLGIKWAPFNQERDDTKSVWVVGLDLTFPTGKVAHPMDVVGGDQGGVGMGHYVITPFMLLSYRYKYIDPYVGMHASIPIQGQRAEDLGLNSPFHGGFLAGLEIVPWEKKEKDQKFAIDFRFTSEFFAQTIGDGTAATRGVNNEVSDFLTGFEIDRQYQSTDSFGQFGIHLSFNYRTGKVVRIRFGASLAHNTQHFITGADSCVDDINGDNQCNPADNEQLNPYFQEIYDTPGQRLTVEETTIFTWWAMAMLTF